MRIRVVSFIGAILALLLAAGCDSTSRPGLLDLGEACSSADACTSGFCAGDVCSQCESDGDCASGESCTDDTAGVGYFVCDDGLAGLGEACAAGTDCSSGFCNTEVCSECEADGDCNQGGTCEDDTAGVGYFVCEGGLADLGEACTAGSDCVSGFCNSERCSECEADGDCAAGETCEDDTAGVGYFVCDDGLADLGEACAAGTDCSSGFCNTEVCSECESDGDCNTGGTCEDDTAGVGYFVCQGGLADLGEVCATGSDCMSGFCNSEICSECETDGDCDADQTCVDDTAGVGYFVCQGAQTGALGDLCAEGGDCDSGICNGNVCSSCGSDADCDAGEACVDDTDGAGYFLCESTLGSLGDNCTEGADCDSGFCRNDRCSLCALNSDCAVQQACSLDPQLGYSLCVGTGDLGDSCDTGDQCISGFCNSGVCSDCVTDGDCEGGGTCIDDMDNAGYFVCSGGLGDACTDGADCNSGFCNNDRCSECEVDGDCGVQQDCIFSGPDGYASCQGTGDLGDSCDSGDQCVSGFCNTGVCSQCEQDADCGVDGMCATEVNNQGFYVCAHELGEPCFSGAQCISGFCFDQPSVCSECETDGDCGTQQICDFSGTVGWASCVGSGDLGDSCDSADQCADGFCVDGVCSACETDADCETGACALDPDGASYYLCLGQLGDECANGADCLSGFCFDAFMQPNVCSECAQDQDCPDGSCEYADGPNYATCRGAGDLGDTCTDGADCASGFCNGDVCSECELDLDCGEGGACLDDTADTGYFICLAGLGEFCETGADCGSGFCYQVFQGLSLCSECTVDGDCEADQTCNMEMGDRFATCEGTLQLGADCQTDASCVSGICNASVCSECRNDADCGDGGVCLDDTADGGYFVCLGSLGDGCTDGADCASGHCFNPPGPNNNVCSECTNDGDCNGGTCTMDYLAGYGTCS